MSATDWVEGGWDLEQTVQVSRWLRDGGDDLIDVSSGGTTPEAKIAAGRGYQVPFAQAVRERASVPASAVGMISLPEHDEKILAEGDADAVMLARELLRDTSWPLRAAHELGAEVTWPPPVRQGAVAPGAACTRPARRHRCRRALNGSC